jgi:hypothetical protein
MSSIFKWNSDFKDIHSLFVTFLGRKAVNEIKNTTMDNYEACDLIWLCQFTNNRYTADLDIRKELLKYFKSKFSHIRCFHACRPSSVNSYYEKGLLPLDYNEQEKLFRNLCADAGHTSVEIEDAIKSISIFINGLNATNSRRKVNLCLDGKLYYQGSAEHYFHGSEYLQYLASQLGDPQVIKIINSIPTVFEIDVPLFRIPNATLKNIVGHLTTEWVSRMIYKNQSYCIDFTLTLESTLPPGYIYRHYHPLNLIKGLKICTRGFCDKCKKLR